MLNKLSDGLLIVAALSLILGIICRLFTEPIVLGITSQAYLQFTQAVLLFAIALGIRELVGAKEKK